MYVYYISEVTAYLKKTWLTPYKEKFVSVWVDKFLHYGNYTTNRVESQHAKLKVYLDSAQSDLPTALPRIDEAVHSQFYAITSSMGQSMVIARHRFSDHDFFKNLVGYVSIHGLEKIFEEFQKINSREFCRCQMRTSHGIPCAHEQAIYLRNGNRIPLESVHTFWKKFDLNPYISLEDEAVDIDVEVQASNTQSKKQSRSGKFSWMQKAKAIFLPSTSSLREPTSQKNKAPTGRPRLSTQRPFIPPTHTHLPTPQPQPTHYPHRQSFSTYTSESTDTNWSDLKQVPERHSTYSFRESPGSNSFFNHESPSIDLNQVPDSSSDPLKNQIPLVFHRYIRLITNVKGDGHCGFRTIALCIYGTQCHWRKVRYELHNELYEHQQEYTRIFGYDLFNTISHTLSYFGSSTVGPEYWLHMPDTAILITNRYRVIVISVSNFPSTWFPMRYGPQDIPNHQHVVIAHVNGNHYVNVDLQGAYPMPPTYTAFYRDYNSKYSAAWETLYGARLNDYVSYQNNT